MYKNLLGRISFEAKENSGDTTRHDLDWNREHAKD